MSFLEGMNRIEEINQFISLLEEFDISLEKISRYVPRDDHQKSLALKMAMQIIEDSDLQNKFISTKEIPVLELCAFANVNSRMVKRHEKYIKSICIIHIYQLTHLKSMVDTEMERQTIYQ